MASITTCLWYDGRAEEAARFYAGIFDDCQLGRVHRAPINYPSGRAGDVLTVEFSLRGQSFIALNGGPHFAFNEAVSFQIFTEDQAETDRLWEAITSDGGEESQCGWCKDKFGVSWQIIPRRLTELMQSEDADTGRRGMAAMMTMRKIDIAALDAAAAGTG